MNDKTPPDQPLSPWKLTPQRIVLLILGILLVLIIASQLLGGLSNYEQLKEASGPAATPPAPAAQPQQ